VALQPGEPAVAPTHTLPDPQSPSVLHDDAVVLLQPPAPSAIANMPIAPTQNPVLTIVILVDSLQ
jgi:hypothetical protein